MKRFIEVIGSKRYVPFFEHLVLVVRCLGIGLSNPMLNGIWTKAVNGADAGRFSANKLSCGAITVDFNRPEPNRYRRSGELRRLAVLPI
ncbi:hypothetical protein [Leptolyngbya sp. Heron Island J]|uniref:hypothetical protein n=1 Tax=Leptolyngbya sp. Heron Island J TaxID=1385935 RepID=UPI00040BDE79|nr:hypothetical protein [Leptolyngbya sp. Heron Island J]